MIQDMHENVMTSTVIENRDTSIILLSGEGKVEAWNLENVHKIYENPFIHIYDVNNE